LGSAGFGASRGPPAGQGLLGKVRRRRAALWGEGEGPENVPPPPS